MAENKCSLALGVDRVFTQLQRGRKRLKPPAQPSFSSSRRRSYQIISVFCQMEYLPNYKVGKEPTVRKCKSLLPPQDKGVENSG